MLCLMSLESVVPTDHPLRGIKSLAEAALTQLSPLFDAMYAHMGRPSVPPERLLKAMPFTLAPWAAYVGSRSS